MRFAAHNLALARVYVTNLQRLVFALAVTSQRCNRSGISSNRAEGAHL
jgi:hypothetical protein